MVVAAQPLQGSEEGEDQTSVLHCSQVRSEQLQSCMDCERLSQTTHIVRESREELQKTRSAASLVATQSAKDLGRQDRGERLKAKSAMRLQAWLKTLEEKHQNSARSLQFYISLWSE
jgi:hypothetical protein